MEECRWCGEEHGARCPWLRAIDFEPLSGVVKRVEFWPELPRQTTNRIGTDGPVPPALTVVAYDPARGNEAWTWSPATGWSLAQEK